MTKGKRKWPCERNDLDKIIHEVAALRSEVIEAETAFEFHRKLHPNYERSARNLVHYLALRLCDVRDLQIELSEWGLSSLGRCERKVLSTLDAVMAALYRYKRKAWAPESPPPVCHRTGRLLLEKHTDELLGDAPVGRRARIMVTMSTEAAEDMELLSALLNSGMNCARINTAHDDEQIWLRMVQNIRTAESRTGQRCRILMDLAGPKIRTGAVEQGPEVVKVRPGKNAYGQVVQPALVWLFSEGEKTHLPAEAKAALPVAGSWLEQCAPGDELRFRDARQAKRRLHIEEVRARGCLARLDKTAYFYSSMPLRLLRPGEKVGSSQSRTLAQLPPQDGYILLRPGDLLLMYRQPIHGRPLHGEPPQPAMVRCSIPEALEHARAGESVWMDDGRIGGIITEVNSEYAVVRIEHARPAGDRLRSEKGINLPDTEIHLPALTEEDKQLIPFVARHADMVGMSFVNRPSDVSELIDLLAQEATKAGTSPPAIVLKVETRRAFERLPLLILEAMRSEHIGVMIARGDLAVECGFERLAEVQEQILWICEAAHVPVIWATQVLEGMAKQGLPTRAEISDAAIGQRAECIMLNKGEHIVEATKALDNILHRMQDHQTKKRSLLRKLHLAEYFFEKK